MSVFCEKGIGVVEKESLVVINALLNHASIEQTLAMSQRLHPLGFQLLVRTIIYSL